MSSRKAHTRARILDGARQLLAGQSFRDVTMDSIAAAAGVSRRTLYVHFPSKLDLFLALADRLDEVEGLADLIRGYEQATDSLAALRKVIEMHALMEPRIFDVVHVLYGSRRDDQAAETVWQDRMGMRHGQFERFASRLERDGLLTSGWGRHDAADLLWFLLSPHAYEYLMLERGWSPSQFVDRIERLLESGLVRAEKQPSGQPASSKHLGAKRRRSSP